MSESQRPGASQQLHPSERGRSSRRCTATPSLCVAVAVTGARTHTGRSRRPTAETGWAPPHASPALEAAATKNLGPLKHPKLPFGANQRGSPTLKGLFYTTKGRLEKSKCGSDAAWARDQGVLTGQANTAGIGNPKEILCEPLTEKGAGQQVRVPAMAQLKWQQPTNLIGQDLKLGNNKHERIEKFVIIVFLNSPHEST